jgi:hypothetical protein
MVERCNNIREDPEDLVVFRSRTNGDEILPLLPNISIVTNETHIAHCWTSHPFLKIGQITSLGLRKFGNLAPEQYSLVYITSALRTEIATDGTYCILSVSPGLTVLVSTARPTHFLLQRS